MPFSLCTGLRLYSAATSTLPAWTSTIGPIFAALVALGIAVVPNLLRHRHRPRLHFQVGDSEPFLRSAISAANQLEYQYLRAAIVNRGRTEARRVQVIVTAWWYTDTNGSWVTHVLDSSPLHWTGMSHAHSGRSTPPEMTIAGGGRWLVDICRQNPLSGETTLDLDDHTDRGFQRHAIHGYANFRIELTLWSQNAEVITDVLAWTNDRRKGIISVHRSRRPDNAQPERWLSIRK